MQHVSFKLDQPIEATVIVYFCHFVMWFCFNIYSSEKSFLVCAFRYGLTPLSTDYLQPSEDELRIELYQGSITEKDARLRGFDLVTGIEL